MAPIVFVSLLLAGTAALAETPSTRGASLYDQHCIGCHLQITGGHEPSLFTRPNRRVQDPAGLASQVRRCRDNLGLTLFDEEVDALVRYLDATHYHFKE